MFDPRETTAKTATATVSLPPTPDPYRGVQLAARPTAAQQAVRMQAGYNYSTADLQVAAAGVQY